MKTEKMAISVRAWNALHKAGISRTEQITALGEIGLLRIRGIGVKTAREVVLEMNYLGFPVVAIGR